MQKGDDIISRPPARMPLAFRQGRNGRSLWEWCRADDTSLQFPQGNTNSIDIARDAIIGSDSGNRFSVSVF